MIMKRLFGLAALLPLLGGVFALTTASCTPKPTVKEDAGVVGCVPDQSFSTATANALTVGTAVTGKICPLLDQDFYSFSSTATDTLAEITVSTSVNLSAVDLSVNVLNAAGMSVGGTADTNGADGPTQIRVVVKLEPSQQHFLLVSDQGNDDFDNNTEFTANVRLFPDPDTNEPNNAMNPTTANTTAAGNQGWLSATGDVDAFRFDAPAGSILRFGLTVPEGATANPQATVSSSEGTSLYMSPPLPMVATNGVRGIRSNVALKGTGPYTVTLADMFGGADYRTPEGGYTLLLEVIPDPDADERVLPARNDSLATPIKVNTLPATRVPSISTVGDTDNYYFATNPADATTGRKILELVVPLPAGTPTMNFEPVLAVWDQVMSIGAPSANCVRVAGPGARRNLCLKPCATGGRCSGDPGGDQQECVLADPEQTTGERYCAEPRVARALKVATDGSVNQTIRYPLRSGRAILVQLGDQLSDSYDERVFSLRATVVDDPDTHEPDDLPPPLLTVGGSGTDVRGQDLSTFNTVLLNSGAGHPTLCPVGPVGDGGVAPDAGGACLGRNVPVDGGSGMGDMRGWPVACGGFDETTMTVTGYLSYEGDRDYYRFEVPEGMYALDMEYTFDPPGNGTTPVEFTGFIYSGNPDEQFGIRGSFVRTQQVDSVNANVNCQFDTNCPRGQECRVREGMGVCRRSDGVVVSSPCSSDGECTQGGVCRPNGPTGGVCRGDCASSLECVNPDAGVLGAVCIEEKCFQDEDTNQGTGGTAVFGPNSQRGECVFANQCNTRPFFVEVVDNGLNDSDMVTPYTLRMRIRCGCPETACSPGVCNYIPCSVGN